MSPNLSTHIRRQGGSLASTSGKRSHQCGSSLNQPRAIDYFKWREATFKEGQFDNWPDAEVEAKCIALASVFPHDNRILQGVACHTTLVDFGQYARGRTTRRYRNSGQPGAKG